MRKIVKDNTKKKDIKDKIIDAALHEFSEKGYEHASTNGIVKRANVSKGMLFYYFKNKEDLYRYLVDMSIKSVETLFDNDRVFSSNDFLKRCLELSKLKLDRYLSDPLLFNFIGNSFLNDSNVPELSDVIAKEMEMSMKMHKALYTGLDTTMLRDDVDSEELIHIIKLTIDGYETELIGNLKGKDLTQTNLDKHWEDFDKFIKNMKKIFYK